MRNAWNAIIAEGGGTFLFLFVGIGSVAMADRVVGLGGESPGLIVIALAHGLVLAILVSALGAVSGGHFNPAVTFGVWIAGHIPTRRAGAYVLAQLIGGLAAAWTLRGIFPVDVSPGLGTPQLAEGIGIIEGVTIEAILTIVLLVAVFGTAIDPRGPKVGGLAIGLALAAGIMMGGPLTGGALNPARWFGPAGVTSIWQDGHVWIIGPLLGAAVAALAYRYFFLPEADMARTPATPAPPEPTA